MNVLFPALMCLALAKQDSAVATKLRPKEAELLWDSPKMRALETEYESLWGTYKNHPEKILGNDGKTKYQHISWLVDDLFGTRLSQRDLRHLAVSCDSLPPSNSDRSQFANSLLAFMVHAFIRQGDRSALVQLLSVRCPSRVGFRTTIEVSLAGAETLQDPILILGEAYSKSTVPEVRHDLAAAVRRGFTDLGIRGDDDTDFVANAMKWYKAERVCLIPNETYSRNDWEVSVEAYEQDPKLYEHRGPWARQLLFERRLPSSEQLDRADVLKGTWDVVQFAENGVIVPPERINVHRWKIGETTIAWIGRYGRDEFGIRFAPNEPHAIDLIRRRYEPDWDQVDTTPLIRELLVDVTPAYYELKGGILKICYPRDGGEQRPASIDFDEDVDLIQVTLRRSPDSIFGPVTIFAVPISLVVAAVVLFRVMRTWHRRRKRSDPQSASLTRT